MGTMEITPNSGWAQWGPSSVNNEFGLEDEIRSEANPAGIVGQSSALRKVLQLVETVACK